MPNKNQPLKKSKVYFITFGCKVNQYETQVLRELFMQDGYDFAEEKAQADIFIVNSCTVTSNANAKTRRQLRSLRSAFPTALIVLTGCLPQVSPDLTGILSDADIVTGTKDRLKLLELVNNAIENNVSQTVKIEPYGNSEEYEDLTCSNFIGHTRAFIKIQDGCERFCAYCIIPYARGPVRSKPIESIAKEAGMFAAGGYKELVLTGINLGLYGMDLTSASLNDAVKVCAGIHGIERIRLSSLEPDLLTDSLIGALKNIKGLCPHFHLPLQSGSAAVLTSMGRRYTPEFFADTVGKLRANFKNCSVTTDIIVGFPGETNKNFVETVDFAQTVGFSKIHVFPYSQRPGTAAAGFSGAVSETVKKQRVKIISELSDTLAGKHIKEQIGKTFPVLVEQNNLGHTPNYTLVKIQSVKKLTENQTVNVKITNCEKNCAVGEL